MIKIYLFAVQTQFILSVEKLQKGFTSLENKYENVINKVQSASNCSSCRQSPGNPMLLIIKFTFPIAFSNTITSFTKFTMVTKSKILTVLFLYYVSHNICQLF